MRDPKKPPMVVMIANSGGVRAGMLIERYSGQLGHIYSPGGLRGPYEEVPFGLDNGRYIATTTEGKTWDAEAFFKMLDRVRAKRLDPLWVLVPDIVGDPAATLLEWRRFAPRISAYGWPLAFAAQDGFELEDMPRNAEVLFIGGTTRWKQKKIWPFSQAFPRVHVGRINTQKWLWECYDAGAESCDGTGWFRGDAVQTAGLYTYLKRVAAGKRPRQQLLRDVAKSWTVAVNPCRGGITPRAQPLVSHAEN